MILKRSAAAVISLAAALSAVDTGGLNMASTASDVQAVY